MLKPFLHAIVVARASARLVRIFSRGDRAAVPGERSNRTDTRSERFAGGESA